VLQADSDQTYTKRIAPGVVLEQRIQTSPNPLIVNAIRVDLKASGIQVRAALGQDRVGGADATKGRETVSTLAARHRALAAVNADFFPWTGDPLGIHITGGELVSDPDPARAAVGITRDGRILFDIVSFEGVTQVDGQTLALAGINRARSNSGLILYTPFYGPSTLTGNQGTEAILRMETPGFKIGQTLFGQVVEVKAAQGDTPIPADGCVLSAQGAPAAALAALKPGDKVNLRLTLKPSRQSWAEVMEAVSGGPWLVRDGQIYIDGKEENMPPSFIDTRHPRTAVGVNASGELLLVTVDGRQGISAGASLPELARRMKDLGAVNAINLDGGGSTTAVVRGWVVNSPSGGKERPVANALLVLGPETSSPTGTLTIIPSQATARSGERVTFSAGVQATAQNAAITPPPDLIWGTAGGIGFVDQGGNFIGIKSGQGQVTAFSPSGLGQAQVTVIPGSPDKMAARWAPDAYTIPNVSTVTATVTDANGNPVPDQPVRFLPAGGITDARPVMTDAKGEATATITWDGPPEERSVEITAPGLKSVLLKYTPPAKPAPKRTSRRNLPSGSRISVAGIPR